MCMGTTLEAISLLQAWNPIWVLLLEEVMVSGNLMLLSKICEIGLTLFSLLMVW